MSVLADICRLWRAQDGVKNDTTTAKLVLKAAEVQEPVNTGKVDTSKPSHALATKDGMMKTDVLEAVDLLADCEGEVVSQLGEPTESISSSTPRGGIRVRVNATVGLMVRMAWRLTGPPDLMTTRSPRVGAFASLLIMLCSFGVEASHTASSACCAVIEAAVSSTPPTASGCIGTFTETSYTSAGRPTYSRTVGGSTYYIFAWNGANGVSWRCNTYTEVPPQFIENTWISHGWNSDCPSDPTSHSVWWTGSQWSTDYGLSITCAGQLQVTFSGLSAANLPDMDTGWFDGESDEAAARQHRTAPSGRRSRTGRALCSPSG